jgi:hypothetical protein
MSTTRALRLVDPKIQLDARSLYDPSTFRTRPGLTIFPIFAGSIDLHSLAVGDLPAITLSSFDVIEVESSNEGQVEDESQLLLTRQFISENELLGCVDQLTAKQIGGKALSLATNGYWNIFNSGDMAACVRWFDEGKTWYVDSITKADMRRANRREFYVNKTE